MLEQLAADIGAERRYGSVAESVTPYAAAPKKESERDENGINSMRKPEHAELELITLATSSKGNATLVRAGETAVLVDAGISARRIEKGLSAAGVNPAALAGIFLTHEHRDHIVGLAQMLKRYHLPVYTTTTTWNALGDIAKLYPKYFVPMNSAVTIGAFIAERFPISHDAADPGGYTFCTTNRKAAICTDLGFVTAEVENALEECDLLVLEANHDPERLRRGPYIRALKERILGAKGHLANEESGRLLARLYVGKQLQVILAHRSETNNTVELADNTVRKELGDKGILCREGEVCIRHGNVLGNVRIAVTNNN